LLFQPTDHVRIRAEIARDGIHIYQLCALVGCHPNRFSRYLNGHEPMPKALGQRIAAILEQRRAPAVAGK
jgi:hypothetical protein